MAISKAYKKRFNRIQFNKLPWTEQDISYFRKAVGHAGIKDAKLKAGLMNSFNFFRPVGGYSITKEQSDKGTSYLLSKSFKLNGMKRKGCRLGDAELAVLKDLPTHTLVGLYQPQMNLKYYLPIYRATGQSGASFDYVGTVYDSVEVLN